MQKGFAPLILLVGILVIIGVASGAYFFGKLPIKPTDNNPKACTQEAKQCPDGSFVGRTGPNCEFSPCLNVAPKNPDASPVLDGTGEIANPDSIEANWKIFNSQCGFTLQYPSDWTRADPPVCGTLQAPNLTKNDIPENYGLFLRFSRWEKGMQTSIFNKGKYTPVIVKTLDDYINSKQNDGITILDSGNKSYGVISGKSFVLDTPEGKYANFIFENGNFIYHVDYPIKYMDGYDQDITKIINSVKF